MIEDLLNQDCSIKYIERGSYGDYVLSETLPSKCRANENVQMVKNNAAEDVVSSIQFWLPKSVDINEKNLHKRLINYNDQDFSIISVRNRRDLYGSIIFKVVSV